MVDSDTERPGTLARSLLHALVDELSRSAVSGDLERRRNEAHRAINAFPLAAAVFGGISGLDPIVNRAWRELLGGTDTMPPEITNALVAVHGGPAIQKLEVEVALPVRVAHIAVTVQYLDAAPGALVVCSDITDEVLTTRVGVSVETPLWCGSGAGDPGYYTRAWRTVIDATWKDAIHPGDLRRWVVALAQAGRYQDSVDIEVRLRPLVGGFRWHRVRFVASNDRVLCAATDIHAERGYEIERNELAAQARSARAEADRANRLKDEFLAAVSHELRAPLTTMLLWERVLREHCSDEASRTQALDAIHHSAVAQERLVADLLDFARGVGGKLYVDIRMVEVEGLVYEVVDAVRPFATERSIGLEVKCAPLTGAVHADAARLRQILDNLLSNALKYTPVGGRVAVGVARRGRSVTIDVEDSGRGIDPEHLDRIFEPFTQVDDSLARREGGLGLGLTISKQLAELHRGSLVAFSAGLGKGARLTLTLPAAGSPRAPSPPVGARRTSTLDGARVLVIDDDARVRKALTVLLGRVGALVETAESAATGHAQIAAAAPQAVICDIAMPGEDGYTFVRRLRADGYTLPSIALTAYATEHDAARALEAGFDVHLAKPISMERLIDTLSDLLAEHRGASL